MRVEIIFDTVCPWCYVGKRRIERAFTSRPAIRPEFIWRPFLLNPDLPNEGIDRRSHLERKFGSEHRVQRVFGAAADAGRAEGIDFRFERIAKTPNSLASHRVVRYAASFGRQTEIVESLFYEHFVHGRDIGDIDVLADIGASQGLGRQALMDYLSSETDKAAVVNDSARASRLGVNGVPCFIFDGGYAVAGAQEADVFLRLIDLTRENETPVRASFPPMA